MTNGSSRGIICREKKQNILCSRPAAKASRCRYDFRVVPGLSVCGGRISFPHFFVRIFVWRCIFISAKEKDTLVNEDIQEKEIRLVGEDGEQLGIMSREQALEMAYSKGLDLVMMAAKATPPVCRIMDFGKYRFDREKREKEAKKKQQTSELKEVQLSCRIDTHDFETKANHAKKFLAQGNKVRAVVKFRGREMSHMEIGREILERFAAYLEEVGTVDKKPSTEGRFMSMIVVPLKPGK